MKVYKAFSVESISIIYFLSRSLGLLKNLKTLKEDNEYYITFNSKDEYPIINKVIELLFVIEKDKILDNFIPIELNENHFIENLIFNAEFSHPFYLDLHSVKLNKVKSIGHYTDINGLHGIITSGSVWATDVQYLNDIKELQTGLSKLDNAPDILTNINLKDIEKIKSEINNFNVFTTSFSYKIDSLDMWSRYSKNNLGICLVFDSIRLGLKFPGQYQLKDTWLKEVRYDINDPFLRIENVLTQINNSKTQNISNKIRPDIIKRMLIEIASFKSNDWKAEDELRLIKVKDKNDTSDIKYRTSSIGLIPYLELNIECGVDMNFNKTIPKKENISYSTMLPLKKIVYGTGFKKKLFEKSMRNFLIKHGYVNTRLEQSNIEYR